MKIKIFLQLMIIIIFGLLLSACSLIALCSPVVSSESKETCTTPAPCPTIPTESSIVGTWEGRTGGTTITFRFQSDGIFIFAMNGSEVDRGQYALLDTIEPIGLIIVYDDGTVIYPIFTFMDTNTLRIENSLPGEPRPTGFSDSMVMTRFIP